MKKIKPNKNHTSHLEHHASSSKGITLIALIITILVMIILVGVTINVALNGGLFETTQQAAKDTQIEADREILQVGVAGALVSEEGITQSSLQNNLPEGWVVEGERPFTVTSPIGNEFTVKSDGSIKEPVELPEGWAETKKLPEWDNEHITAVTDGTNTIPLPEGYQISDNPEENTIEKGVVIKDSKGNEFIWIPVSTDFNSSYKYDSDRSEPRELTSRWQDSVQILKPYQDSLEILIELYGTKEGTDEPFYSYETDFAYATHYAEMVESVNKYNGFYIGRYETTIDENNNIGSKYNKTVLTANKTISQTNNKLVRWYGLYYTERNSNVTGNKEYIQTNMIWGQQWDAMIEYFDTKSLDYSEWGESIQGAVVNSGQSTNENMLNDKIYNIYDLRTNCYDWSAEGTKGSRTRFGGAYYNSCSATDRININSTPTMTDNYNSSRLTLYIK